MRCLATLMMVLAVTSSALAQDTTSAPAADPQPAIDATKLGVSLSRIQKGLRIAESKEKEMRDGLRLEFQIQVYGRAPRIEVLKGVDLFNGAVPGTAPTHRDIIDFLTPQIYRTPGLPISALAMWATQHFWEKGKKARCEEEIANYRALLMQGVNVSAPRCTQ
jgi:hypothetical protein